MKQLPLGFAQHRLRHSVDVATATKKNWLLARRLRSIVLIMSNYIYSTSKGGHVMPRSHSLGHEIIDIGVAVHCGRPFLHTTKSVAKHRRGAALHMETVSTIEREGSLTA